MPVVTFTYLDPEDRNLDAYIGHLRAYRPLFRQLPNFHFGTVQGRAETQLPLSAPDCQLATSKTKSDLAA